VGRGYLLVLAPDWFSVCAVICPVLPRCCARAWRTADRLRRVGRLARERSAVLFRRHARFADRRQHRHHTEHDLKPPGRRGDQIGCCSATPKRLLDVEQVRVRICRKHLGHNGGDNADIMGAIGKQHGVTVLDGKWHDLRIALLDLARTRAMSGTNPVREQARIARRHNLVSLGSTVGAAT